MARRGRRRAARSVSDRGIMRMLAAEREPFPASLTRSVAPPGLSEIADDRVFDFDDDRGPVTLGGGPARVVVGRGRVEIAGPLRTGWLFHRRPWIARSRTFSSWGITNKGLPVGVQLPVGLRFESPFRVLTCLRRKVRRAVIFAKGKRHKGAGARRDRTYRSNIGC